MLIKSMAVFAGMLDAMDFHIGRFVTYLKDTGQYENTIFIVTADNGPEGNNPSDHEAWRAWFETSIYDRDYENLGDENSYVYIGTEFAQAMASPSHLFKFHMSEGGLRVPLIIKGPNFESGKNDNFSFVTDIAATLSDVVYGSVRENIIGKSLKKSLQGSKEKNYLDTDAVGLEVTGNSALFKGDYKIVRNRPPHGSNAWELYNLTIDPGETNNLSEDMPDKLNELISDYKNYVELNGVIELPIDYSWAKEMSINTLKRLLIEYIWWISIGLVIVLVLIIVIIRKTKPFFKQ